MMVLDYYSDMDARKQRPAIYSESSLQGPLTGPWAACKGLMTRVNCVAVMEMKQDQAKLSWTDGRDPQIDILSEGNNT